MDVEGLAVICNMSAQNLNLLKLSWSITDNQCSDALRYHKGTHTQQVTQNKKPTHNLHTVKLLDARGKHHPFPLIRNCLLKEYEDVFRGIGCFPGAPHDIEIDPEVFAVQHAPRQVPVRLQQAYIDELDQLKKHGNLYEVHNEVTRPLFQ